LEGEDCRRRRYRRRRHCVWGVSGGQGTQLAATAPPPALARPAAHVWGGHGKGRIAPSVGIAGGGTACGGWRAVKGRNSLRLARRRRWRDRRRACWAGRGAGVLPPAIVRPAAAIWRGGLPPASVWPAAALRVGGGGGKGGVHLLLLRRRCRQDRRRVHGAAMWRDALPPASVWPAGALRVWGRGRASEASTCFCSAAGVGKTGGACSGRASCGAGCRRRRYGRRWLCVLGGAGGRGRVLELSGPSPALARPAAGVWSAEGTGCVGVLPPAFVCRHLLGV